MKRITSLFLSLVCFALMGLAQDVADSVQLSPEQWEHGLAVAAQWGAIDKGFGKNPAEKLPEGYTLDDVNKLYSPNGGRWSRIYDPIKRHQGKPGTMGDLKKIAGRLQRQVGRDMAPFMKAHPASRAGGMLGGMTTPPQNPQPEGQAQADGQNPPPPEMHEGQPQDHAGEPMPPHDGKHHDGKPHKRGFNWALLWGLLGCLLGACGLWAAFAARRDLNELRKDVANNLNATNNNLQEFANDTASQMRVLAGRIQRNNASVAAAAQPVVEELADEEEEESEDDEEPVEQVLFLGKPDEDDNFTRVSEEFELGNTIYGLTTTDGVHGTFEVIDRPEVHEFALMMPSENLMRACEGENLQVPDGTRIINDQPGEAEFVDGKWHVTTKALIHYV